MILRHVLGPAHDVDARIDHRERTDRIVGLKDPLDPVVVDGRAVR